MTKTGESYDRPKLSPTYEVQAWDNPHQYGAPVSLLLTGDYAHAVGIALKAVTDIYTVAEVVTKRYWGGDQVVERTVHYRATANRPVDVVR